VVKSCERSQDLYGSEEKGGEQRRAKVVWDSRIWLQVITSGAVGFGGGGGVEVWLLLEKGVGGVFLFGSHPRGDPTRTWLRKTKRGDTPSARPKNGVDGSITRATG